MNDDSWYIMDIITVMSVPQRRDDFLASLYQPVFSENILQMFSLFSGGALVQPVKAITRMSTKLRRIFTNWTLSTVHLQTPQQICL